MEDDLGEDFMNYVLNPLGNGFEMYSAESHFSLKKFSNLEQHAKVV